MSPSLPTVHLMTTTTAPPSDARTTTFDESLGTRVQLPEDPSTEATLHALNAYAGPDIWTDLIWPHLEIDRAGTAWIDIDRHDRFLDQDGHLYRYELSIQAWILDDDLLTHRRTTD